MVYRGKPSAGCENCRKAKKKCTLEQPACARCVKLNKPCSGYRDTTGLQIQDETLSVTRKAEKKKTQHSLAISPSLASSRSQTATPTPDPLWDSSKGQPIALGHEQRASTEQDRHNAHNSLAARSSTPLGIPTPHTIHSESSSSSEGTFEVFRDSDYPPTNDYDEIQLWSPQDEWNGLPKMLAPKPDDIAVSYFLNCFTASGHWDYVLRYAALPKLDPCLTLAMKACGMAALENIRYVPRGREWSRSMYMNAISMLNTALRDPKRCKTDESLIAVSMLSFFEVNTPASYFLLLR